MKLETHDLNYFLGKKFFGDDGSQNIFVYQPTFTMLELNIGKVTTDYVIDWKSKGVYNFKLT